jgi:hypothetical protein
MRLPDRFRQVLTIRSLKAKQRCDGLMNFLAFNAFVLLLPVCCIAAWIAGSTEERWLMRVAFCALGPF